MKTHSSNSTDSEAFQNELEMQFPSDTFYVAAVRRLVEHVAQHRGFDESAIMAIGLCLNEAIANIIRHAYSGQSQKPIKITVAFAAEKLGNGELARDPAPSAMRISLRDWGAGLYPSQTQTVPRDALEPGGLGLICLHKLMDQITYTPQVDGMLLVLVKHKAAKSIT